MPTRLILMATLLVAPAALAGNTLVHTSGEFDAALGAARAGDTITLANGVWRDVQLLFRGEGRPDAPITLTAQSPGGAILSGQSNLRMAGRYLVVSNLVFRDGYSPTSEVVSFRRNQQERAVHSRVTGIVIDGYSKPDRLETDNWVAMYGSDNRFDHSQLAGKTNAGTTLVVVRDAGQGLDNRHRIDHNFFGERPNLGMNGGETIRVGTSHDAQSDSHTVVEDNWFEHCDGEIEIISNKSGANVYRRNVFFESRGALVLRHGDGNLVEDNVFLGNGKPHTGGIRVINRRQTVRNNYLEGLAGAGFASALTVMYGVPDSPPNRYVQVEGALIANNTIVDAHSIFLGAGRDEERSARPIDSRLEATLIVNRDGHDALRTEGDLSGLKLSGNVQSAARAQARDGIALETVELRRNAQGLLEPAGLAGVGAHRDLRPIARGETGVPWYPKARAPERLDSGREVRVGRGEQAFISAVAGSRPGDRLLLSAEPYQIDRVLTIAHPLTIEGPEVQWASISFSRPTLFDIASGGSLRLSRLAISGLAAPDSAGNAVIRTRPGPGTAIRDLVIEDSRISDLTVNRAFSVFAAARSTLTDRVVLKRVTVERVSGDVISAHAETDDLGAYNIEWLEIRSSTFRNIAGAIVSLYRGGSDESTFGPRLALTGSTLEQVGLSGGADPAALRLQGVQSAELRDNRVIRSGGLRFTRTAGEPVLILADNTFVDSPAWGDTTRRTSASP